MKRIASGTQVASLPTHPAGTGTPGYFADAGTTPSDDPTELTPEWFNSVQEAIVRTIEDGGGTPATDFDLFKTTVGGVHGIKAHATDTGVTSSAKTRVVVGALNSRASAAESGVFGGSGNIASAVGAGTFGGDTNAATAVRTACTGGTGALASAADAGTFAGDNPTASGLKATAVGGADLTASGENAAAVGGDTNIAGALDSFVGGGSSHDVQSGSTGGAILGGLNHTIGAARSVAMGGDSHQITGADSFALGGEDGIVAAAQSGAIATDTCIILDSSGKPNKVLVASLGATLETDGNPSGGGADGYCLAGGHTNDPVGGAANTDVTWLLSSKHGTLALDNTTLIAGADYAEYFPNVTEEAIPPGSLVARQGKRVRLAQPGDRILGVVSAAPSVVGNAAGLGWSGAKLRDEWGALIYEEREVCRFEITEIQQIEHCQFKITEPNDKGKPVLRFRYKGPVAKCPVEIPTHARRYEVATPVVVYRYLGPVSKCPVEIPADAERWMSRDPVRNPDFDPSQPYSPQQTRPDQWTCVALLGQVRVRIGPAIEEGDYLNPGFTGLAVGTLARPDGRPVEVMEVTLPYDEDRGYGVALCLVG